MNSVVVVSSPSSAERQAISRLAALIDTRFTPTYYRNLIALYASIVKGRRVRYSLMLTR